MYCGDEITINAFSDSWVEVHYFPLTRFLMIALAVFAACAIAIGEPYVGLNTIEQSSHGLYSCGVGVLVSIGKSHKSPIKNPARGGEAGSVAGMFQLWGNKKAPCDTCQQGALGWLTTRVPDRFTCTWINANFLRANSPTGNVTIP